MTETSLQQDVEKLSEALVFAEPSDLNALANLHTGFQALSESALADRQDLVASAMTASAELLENIILSEVDDPAAALGILAQGLAATQSVVRDGRDPGEAEFPPELAGAGEDESTDQPALSPVVDQRILGDFLSRQPGVLEEMEGLILALEKGEDKDKMGQLRRLVHTLKGEAGMLGLAAVERLCHTAEDALNNNPVSVLTDILLDVKDWLGRCMEALANGNPAPGAVDKLMERLQNPTAEQEPETVAEAVQAPPEPKMLEGDPDLLGEFVSEAKEHLENADLNLLTLETDPTDEEAMNAVFRAFHTIKGVAGFLALDGIQSLSHEAESLLDQARKGGIQLVGGYVDITFEAVDMLKRQIDHVAEALASGSTMPIEASMPDLIRRLNAAVSGKEPETGAAAPTAAPTPSTQPLGQILVETGATTPAAIQGAVAAQQQPPEIDKLGELLLGLSAISRSQLDQALEFQKESETEKKLGDVLIEMGAVRQEDIDAALEKQEHPPAPKLGETLVKQGEVKAQEVAKALRAQKPRQAAEVKEAVKVDADRLDRLIDCIGELVIAESMVSQSDELASVAPPQVVRQLGQLDKITRELQEMGMSLRMVPIRATFQKMARLVRDLAKKSGKKVEFLMVGEDTELDKSVVDKIGDPLVHMVRNSVDHGIEASPADRVAAGKSEMGTVELRAFHKGGSIYIEIQDNGRGLDRDAILNKARERGLVRENDQLSDREVWNLIFEPGFSTAKQVTDVSGRGVGMDVVRRNIESLRGQVDIQSEKGKGSTFSIRLPLTLAIIDGMVVRVGQERYIIPTLSVIRSIRPEADDIHRVVGKGEMLSLQGDLLPLFRLHELFNIEDSEQDATKALAVVVEDDNRHIGVLVDELLGQQQTVIKSLGEAMSDIQGVSGGAIMSDGRVGLILDVSGLLRLATTAKADEEDAVATADEGTA
ncbi:MAG: chemotaxis protein CheA [bacterium]|nr:chemotaxis protein CheA [bacterium]